MVLGFRFQSRKEVQTQKNLLFFLALQQKVTSIYSIIRLMLSLLIRPKVIQVGHCTCFNPLNVYVHMKYLKICLVSFREVRKVPNKCQILFVWPLQLYLQFCYIWHCCIHDTSKTWDLGLNIIMYFVCLFSFTLIFKTCNLICFVIWVKISLLIYCFSFLSI